MAEGGTSRQRNLTEETYCSVRESRCRGMTDTLVLKTYTIAGSWKHERTSPRGNPYTKAEQLKEWLDGCLEQDIRGEVRGGRRLESANRLEIRMDIKYECSSDSRKRIKAAVLESIQVGLNGGLTDLESAMGSQLASGSQQRRRRH